MYNYNNYPTSKQTGNVNNKFFNYDINKTERKKKLCGIINYGNNCYFNSGLQILATCKKLVEELKKSKNINSGFIGLINEAMCDLLNKDKEKYDPKNFLNYFCKITNENFFSQYCSQDFIRILLNNLNKELISCQNPYFIYQNIQYKPQNQIEYQQFSKFTKSNNYFPESMALKLFSGLTKCHSSGKCKYCTKEINNFSFSYFIDQYIYLDDVYDNCDFKDVLSKNFGNYIKLTMNCPYCKNEINIKEEIKFIKLPEILIFTLDRYKGDNINKTLIKPNATIDMKEYLDSSIYLNNTQYGLFAINIRLSDSHYFGHEICQVKRNGQWYEINDTESDEKTKEYNDKSYGLFYERL
jgi:ubiquitin C-terminal hydrolase